MESKSQLSNTLNRYSRQMILPQIGSSGQDSLSSSSVLVIGAGGIGSTVLMYLASSGVPAVILDFDTVDVSNLHR
jgi:molybdopterin/thiamine biosynthesis adenylyltransferase